MKIIKPYFVIMSKIDGNSIINKLEEVGRTAYKSEKKIPDTSAKYFIKTIIENRHLSVIEHVSITVRIICDRGVSHEIVRHRIASYCQESTRYCDYSKDQYNNEITVIEPLFWDKKNEKDFKNYHTWENAIKHAEKSYIELIKGGASPQEARAVLPNSLKTEIVVTMNLREWRHFFSLRTSEFAHPQMQELVRPLLNKFKELVPIIFDDINY